MDLCINCNEPRGSCNCTYEDMREAMKEQRARRWDITMTVVRLTEENNRLKKENEQLRKENERLESSIRGVNDV